MKIPIFILAGSGLCLALGACAGSKTTGGSPALYVGETKAEVIATLEQPMTKAATSDGYESWVYVFGLGKKFIPFYGPFTDSSAVTVTFGPNGRLLRWANATTHL